MTTRFAETKELGPLFSAVANGDVRAILHYVQRVIRSGQLDTQKMLLAVQDSGRYTIATHEALRALLFGDYKHYHPDHSLFLNLFDLEHSEPREHFSRLLTLQYFAQAAVSDGSYGYRERHDVVAHLHRLSYTGPHINNVLAALYNRKYLEGPRFDAPFDQAGPTLRITGLGRYHATKLVRTFVYLDAVIVDTPILDTAVRGKCSQTNELPGRLARAREFLRYLNRCAEELQDKAAVDVWGEVHDAVEADIAHIESSD